MILQSIKDETGFLMSGKGNPYEKIAFVVALFITVIFTVMMGMNYPKNAPVTVIDMDNSRYSHELTEQLDNSRYIKVVGVLNSPAEPSKLMYRDKSFAVIYFPQDLEKKHYSGEACEIGVFYDNITASTTSGLKTALNEMIAEINNENYTLGTNDTIMGGLTLNDRDLFNPVSSNSNAQVLGFLIFFSSMFYAFALLGLVPRLRLMHQLDGILLNGSGPLDIAARVVPYALCWMASVLTGFAVLRTWGDITFSGSIPLFMLTEFFYIMVLGIICVTFGWTAANPGIASSRMILVVPMGFIFGGFGVPMTQMPVWVDYLRHAWPLTWEFEFVRDIVLRGAGFMDIMTTFGGFMIYTGVALLLLYKQFYKSQREAKIEKDFEAMLEDD